MKLCPDEILAGKYRILEQIGTGGSADIYKAVQLPLNRTVILKVFTGVSRKDISVATTSIDAQQYDSISANEIKCMMAVNHPQIPKLYEVLNLDNTIVIVMEYCHGMDLLRWIRNHGAISVDAAVDYACQLCRIVEYLHNLKPAMLHCDIKPNNIIISSEDKSIRLLDLGLSRIVSNCSDSNILGRTDGYSPPEFYPPYLYTKLKKSFYAYQCRSVAYRTSDTRLPVEKLNAASDVYCIGATLYYMLTACHPSYSNTDFSIISDPNMRMLLQKAMSEDPGMRFQSVSNLREAISYHQYEFDFALSYASEDRHYVDDIARILKENHVRIYYYPDQQIRSWGTNILTRLNDVYGRKSRYCIIFISEHYRDKKWTSQELYSALEREMYSKNAYILPVKIDDTEIPGIKSTTGYMDLREMTTSELAWTIIRKLNET